MSLTEYNIAQIMKQLPRPSTDSTEDRTHYFVVGAKMVEGKPVFTIESDVRCDPEEPIYDESLCKMRSIEQSEIETDMIFCAALAALIGYDIT